MNAIQEIKTKQKISLNYNQKLVQKTKAQILFDVQQQLPRLQNLINRLYINEIKPSISNIDDVSALVIVENYNEVIAFVTLYETNNGFLTLGNYQCVNDESIAKQLFEKVKQYAQSKGHQKLLGPMNGNTWHSHRFNIKQVAPFFLEHQHKNYYLKQWENAGFKPYAEYFTFQERLKRYIPNQKNLNWLDDKPKLSVRHFNVEDADEDLSLLHQFCSEAFANNLLYKPISEKAFKTLYQPILPYLKNDLIDLVIEKNKNKERLVGFLFAMEDVYQPKRLIIKTIARKSGDAYKGLAHFLVERLLLKAANKGYEKLLHAYMESNNKSVKMSQKFGGETYQDHILLSLSL